MIQLIPINLSSDYEQALKGIYLDAFPADERRDWQELMILTRQVQFHLYGIISYHEPVGLITVWKWPELSFIEHFAIAASMQGKGIGSEVLKKLMKEIHPPIILETEQPTTEAAIRRVAFYARLGFHVCTEAYYQPPYANDKKMVKMHLMSYPHKITTSEFTTIRAKLYKEVYHRNTIDFL